MRSRDRRQSSTRYHLVADDLSLVGYARQFWKTASTPWVIVLSPVDILYIPRVLQVRARPDVSLVILRDEPLLYNKEYRMTKNIREILRKKEKVEKILFYIRYHDVLTPLPLLLLFRLLLAYWYT